MAKDAVQPVAVLRGDRSVGQLLALAVVGPPGIVTSLGYTAMLSSKHKTIRTIVELWDVINTLPVPVTILIITHDT